MSTLGVSAGAGVGVPCSGLAISNASFLTPGLSHLFVERLHSLLQLFLYSDRWRMCSMLQPHLCHLLFAVTVPLGHASLCHLQFWRYFWSFFPWALSAPCQPGMCWECCFSSRVIVLPLSMLHTHVSSLPFTPFLNPEELTKQPQWFSFFSLSSASELFALKGRCFALQTSDRDLGRMQLL